jgi:hypothetical protein
LADTEDALAKLTPARVVRCRQGNIPLAAVLDVHDAPPPPAAAAATGGGVISHEAGHAQVPRLVLDRQPAAGAAGGGGRGIKRRLSEDAAAGAGGPLRAPHALELERISTVVWRATAGPVCAAAFASWLLRAAAHAPGLLRAKGQLWLSQCRRQRFSFHFSGARRVEAVAEEPWEGAGSTTVVLIGTDRGELLALRDALEASAATRSGSADATARDASAAFTALLAADARFELPPPAAADGVRDAPGFVAFSLRGRPHQGVHAAALNCALARRANAAAGQRLLVWGAPAYATVRVVFSGADEDVAAAHAGLLSHADAVLRDAMQHIGLCSCG